METENKEISYVPTNEGQMMQRIYAIRVMDFLAYQTPRIGKFLRTYPDMDLTMFQETIRDLQQAIFTKDFSKFQ